MQLNTFHFFFLSDFRSIYAFLFAVFLFCALFWCFCTLLRERVLASGGLYGWIASPACPVLSKLSKLNDFTYDSFNLTSHLRGVYNRKNITRVFGYPGTDRFVCLLYFFFNLLWFRQTTVASFTGKFCPHCCKGEIFSNRTF